MDHPLDMGDTSAVEPGPWHYGADYVTTYFTGDRSKLKGFLPRPFELGDGTCMAYVCEIVCVSEGRPEAVGEDPDKTSYKEAALGITCVYRGSPGIYFPVMWVDTEWSLLRGLLNGYAKRLADKIVMTKLHSLNPGLKTVGEGSKFVGYCVKGGERTLRLAVEVERKGEPKDLISFGATYGMRRFPPTGPGQTGVAQAVEMLKSNSRTSDVWIGKGSIDFSLDFGEPEVILGALYKAGFTISGSKALTDSG